MPPPFVRPREQARLADEAKTQFADGGSDHLTLLHAFDAYQNSGESADFCWNNFLNARSLRAATDVRKQLERLMQKLRLPVVGGDLANGQHRRNVCKALLAGFFMQVAHQERGGYYMVIKDQQKVLLHPSHSLDRKPEFVVYNEFVLTKQNYIRICTAVDADWLVDVAPHYYEVTEDFPDGESKYILQRVWQRKQSSSQPVGGRR